MQSPTYAPVSSREAKPVSTLGFEHLQEVAHTAPLRLLAEGGERLEAPEVVLDAVVEGDRVQAEIASEVARGGRTKRFGTAATARSG